MRINIIHAHLLGLSVVSALLLLNPPAVTAQVQSEANGKKSDLEAIIVTASRLAETARQEQKIAANLINVQSAEDMAKYPDFDAAEALGRISGVSLSGDTGEGRFISIRGMDGNFNGATFGGVTLLNTNPQGTNFSGSGRAVEFDTIPLGAVDRIVVTKTGLPDRDAEGLGGSVELTPRSAAKLTRAFFLEATLGGGYERGHSNFAPFRVEATIGGRFGDGKGFSATGPLSFVLTASEFDDRRGFDDIEASYLDNPAYPDKATDNYQLRRYSDQRKRSGIGGDFEFTPNDAGSYFARFSIAGYTEYSNRMKLIFSGMGNNWPTSPSNAAQFASPDPNNPNGFIAPATTPQNVQTDQQESHHNSIFALGGQNHFGNVFLEYQVAYSRAVFNSPYGLSATFAGTQNLVLAYDNITNPNYPSFKVLNGLNPADPRLYTLAGFVNQTGHDVDQEPSYKVDLSVPVHLLSDSDQFKVGLKAGFRNKSSAHEFTNYDILPTVPLTSDLGSGPYTNYYGRYNIGYQAGNTVFANPLFGRSAAVIASDVASDAAAYFNDKETIYAGYLQYMGTIKDVSVLTGLRAEKTDATFGGNTVNTNTGTFTPTNRKSNYTNFFPTLQFRYQPVSDLVGRLTYSTGISRPGFLPSSSATQVDYSGGAVTSGNPDLKPTTGKNYDLSIEYYLPHAGILSFGAFGKTFSNFIVSREVPGSYPGIIGPAKFFTFENIPSAWARGLEGSYQQKFSFLPDPFDDLGITSNATYVDSAAHVRLGENNILPGTSRYTGNAGLFYESKKVEIQLSVEYVGKSLFTVGSSAALDAYEDARTTVDFTSRYFAIPNASIYFNAKNLTNSPLRFFEGSTNRPIQREYYEYTLELGVSATF